MSAPPVVLALPGLRKAAILMVVLAKRQPARSTASCRSQKLRSSPRKSPVWTRRAADHARRAGGIRSHGLDR